MQKYYIPHKIKSGDITHLADNDSDFAIKSNIAEEDVIDVTAPNGIFQAQVTFIDKASVEVEIIKKLEDAVIENTGITILQAVSNITKFGLFLEKITEIGVLRIVPVVTELSIVDQRKAQKQFLLWEKIIRDATEQSRNPNPPILEKVVELSAYKTDKSALKLCFVTENINTIPISKDLISHFDNVILAFGPESGWSFDELEILKKNGFKFVNLKGNILRTETTPIVATSIIKFIQGKL